MVDFQQRTFATLLAQMASGVKGTRASPAPVIGQQVFAVVLGLDTPATFMGPAVAPRERKASPGKNTSWELVVIQRMLRLLSRIYYDCTGLHRTAWECTGLHGTARDYMRSRCNYTRPTRH